MQKETRKLTVQLTDLEVENYGRELASCLVKIETLNEQRKAITQTIDPLKKRSTVLSQTIEDGNEIRDIECSWQYDWSRSERSLYRLDTGEIVETDIIPEHEKQQHLI